MLDEKILLLYPKDNYMKSQSLIWMILLSTTIFSSCHKDTVSKDKQMSDIEIQDNVIKNINSMHRLTDVEIKFDSMGYPIVTKDFEIFDFETYNNRPDKDDSSYRMGLPEGIVIEIYTAGKGSGGGFYHNIYYPNSYFFISKRFRPDCTLIRKGLMYVQGFNKGIWYEFDESGELIKETDYDKPFQFAFEDVVRFCEKNNIKLAKGYKKTYDNSKEWYENLFCAYIRRNVFEGTCKWEIMYAKEESKSQYGHVWETITLDGKTGKVISIEQQDYELN